MPGEVWMVARDGVGGDATFGPFEDRPAAEKFVSDARESFEKSGYIGHPGFVYDAVAERASLCGPWRL